MEGSATNVFFIPSLKNKQGPEGLSIILFSCELFVNELFHVRIMKDALPLYSLLSEIIQHEFLQLSAQPLCEWNPKPFLLPMNDSSRQQTLRSLFQQVLRFEAVEL